MKTRATVVIALLIALILGLSHDKIAAEFGAAAQQPAT